MFPLDPNETFVDLQSYITIDNPEFDSTDITHYFQTFQPELEPFSQEFKARSLFQEFSALQTDEQLSTPSPSSQEMGGEILEQNQIVFPMFNPQHQVYYPYQQQQVPFQQQYGYQQGHQIFSIVQNQQTGVYEYAAVNQSAQYNLTQYMPVTEESSVNQSEQYNQTQYMPVTEEYPVNHSAQYNQTRYMPVTEENPVNQSEQYKQTRCITVTEKNLLSNFRQETHPERPQKKSTPKPSELKSPLKRKRATITKYQRAVLTETFSAEKFPTRQTRKDLGYSLDLHPRQVQIWFQNARSKFKKTNGLTKPKKTEVKIEN